MKRHWRIAIIAVALGALCGCATPSRFAVVSYRGIHSDQLASGLEPITDLDVFFERVREKGTRVWAEDSVQIIGIFPTAFTQPRLDEAVRKALKMETTPPSPSLTQSLNFPVLVDVEVHYSRWYIPFIYGEFGWTVTGTQIGSKDLRNLIIEANRRSASPR